MFCFSKDLGGGGNGAGVRGVKEGDGRGAEMNFCLADSSEHKHGM